MLPAGGVKLPAMPETPPAGEPLLGIDLGGTKTQAVLLDAAGRTIWQRRIPTPKDYDAALREIAALADAAQAAAGAQAARLRIGVGGPGTLTSDGRVKNANSTWLNGRSITVDLAALSGREVRYANDANCLALSEATDGAGAGHDVVFAAIVGTGTGAGIAVRGRVLTGPNGVAGEWGHVPLPWSVPGEDPAFDCWCGQRGCNETVLSGPGIARDHALVTGTGLSAAEIAARARAGDAACAATLERHASRMARALAGVVNVLDPDIVVLGGGVSLMPHLYERVPALWGRWIASGGLPTPVRTKLVASRHGDASGVRGAAWLWRG
jgi:fructokinase